MGDDSGEKTEEPTPHKLREARKKGQIAKSKELTSAILMMVAFYTLRAMSTRIWKNMSDVMSASYGEIGLEFTLVTVSGVLNFAFKAFFAIMLPFIIILFILGALIEALQTGFLISSGPLEPKLDNISPIQGFKRLFSLKQVVELLKSIIKMVFIIGIIYSVLSNEFFIVIQAQARSPWLIVGYAAKLVMKMVTQAGIAYIILALLDYLYQRYEFFKQMRMSKKEIKEEFKKLEGDPIIKQRQRESQRNMAMSRQMGAVPGADVVVTNPTHYAIALKYEHKVFNAPVVVAKGKDLLAQDIKKIAKDYDVPTIENPPLAQSLFKSTKPGQQIPEETFQIVAEILAFVYKLKKKKVPKSS